MTKEVKYCWSNLERPDNCHMLAHASLSAFCKTSGQKEKSCKKLPLKPKQTNEGGTASVRQMQLVSLCRTHESLGLEQLLTLPLHPHTLSSGTIPLSWEPYEVLVCLCFVSLSLHLDSIKVSSGIRHCHSSPGSEGGKLTAGTTSSWVAAAACSRLASFHWCAWCNTSCRWVFRTKKKKKRKNGISQFPVPLRAAPWSATRQAAARLHLSRTGALHLR